MKNRNKTENEILISTNKDASLPETGTTDEEKSNQTEEDTFRTLWSNWYKATRCRNMSTDQTMMGQFAIHLSTDMGDAKSWKQFRKKKVGLGKC